METKIEKYPDRHRSQLEILYHLEKRRQVLLDMPPTADVGYVGDISPFFINRELFCELFRGCEVAEDADGTLRHSINGVPFLSRSAGPRATRKITLE